MILFMFRTPFRKFSVVPLLPLLFLWTFFRGTTHKPRKVSPHISDRLPVGAGKAHARGRGSETQQAVSVTPYKLPLIHISGLILQ